MVQHTGNCGNTNTGFTGYLLNICNISDFGFPLFLPAYRRLNTKIQNTKYYFNGNPLFYIYHNIGFQIMQEALADLVKFFRTLLFLSAKRKPVRKFREKHPISF